MWLNVKLQNPKHRQTNTFTLFDSNSKDLLSIFVILQLNLSLSSITKTYRAKVIIHMMPNAIVDYLIKKIYKT